jgi:hypothetical protein
MRDARAAVAGACTAAILLAACGAETAGTAATAARLQASAAEQAQVRQQQIQQQLGGALQQGADRAASAPGQ